MRFSAFKQLQEINDLMITPITDVGPGVLGLGFLPVDTLAGNAIRIVSVRR